MGQNIMNNGHNMIIQNLNEIKKEFRYFYSMYHLFSKKIRLVKKETQNLKNSLKELLIESEKHLIKQENSQEP